MNWKVLGAGMAVVLPLVAVLASGFGNDPRVSSNALEGKLATQIELTDLDGNEFSLTAMAGKPVLVNFWATWCGPCAQEHAHLLQAHKLYGDRVQFVAVLYGDEPTAARDFLSKRGSAYPTLIDENQRVAIDYGVAGVPETFFIDKNGQIAKKVSGPISVDLVAVTLEGLLK